MLAADRPALVMETKVLKINPSSFADEELAEAVALIRQGELVSFPTETVYGLGANALDNEACKKIFQAKGRPSDNPLIVHVSSMEMLHTVAASVPPKVDEFLTRSQFWPGPLTILFPKKENVPQAVTAGQTTVAVRMPSHPIAHKLIALSGVPIAAPSANLSGRPSPTTAGHVIADLTGRVKCIVDGGGTSVGLESTVLDMSRDPPMILRPGGITHEQLKRYLPDVVVYGQGGHKDQSMEDKPPTPGLKYRHYSPNAYVVLFDLASSAGGDDGSDGGARMGEALVGRVRKALEDKQSVGIIHTHKEIELPKDLVALARYVKDTEGEGEDGEVNATEKRVGENDTREPLLVYPVAVDVDQASEEGRERFAAEVARGLFKALRGLDAQGVDIIFVEGIDESHTGYAVMNRLRKAAATSVSCRGL